MDKIRIISGIYKNRPLQSPQGMAVRPTSGRVRQSLFNILQFQLVNKRFLDIFCGTGQMGLEALSRGAKRATFVDADTALVQKNATSLHCGSEAEVIRGEFASVLFRLRLMGSKYDFIFADPPYEAGYYEDIIRGAAPLLAEDGMLILEHSSKHKILGQDSLFVTETRQYGSRSLTFLKEEPHEDTYLSGQL